MKKIMTTSLLLAMVLAGCSTSAESTETVVTVDSNVTETAETTESTETAETVSSTNEANDEMFTERDLEQTANLEEAVYITLADDESITIDEAGVYVLTGDVSNTTVTVDVEDEKVQLVLDGVTITNEDQPAIYVQSADKVFITTTDSDNLLEVSGSYVTSGDVNWDAVIYSKEDLVLNGTGSLTVISEEGNGITSKDDLKVTGGTIIVESAEDGLEANDSIRVYDGNITITSGKDAFHSENEDDLSLGYIYIQNGNITISAADDAIRGTSYVLVDGGVITIEKSVEGIEATQVIINDGDITINASDDGINATNKSNLDVLIEIYGGTLDITMGSGDTDAIDSNGDLYVYGGDITMECGSSFDADGTAELLGGNVTVNGQVVTEITAQHMGGPGMGKPSKN